MNRSRGLFEPAPVPRVVNHSDDKGLLASTEYFTCVYSSGPLARRTTTSSTFPALKASTSISVTSVRGVSNLRACHHAYRCW